MLPPAPAPQSVLQMEELPEYVQRPSDAGVAVSVTRATLAWPATLNTFHANIRNKRRKR